MSQFKEHFASDVGEENQDTILCHKIKFGGRQNTSVGVTRGRQPSYEWKPTTLQDLEL